MGLIDDQVQKFAAVVTAESERTRDLMADHVGQSIRGLAVAGALPRTIAPNAVNYSAGRRLVGWSVRAKGGALVLNLRDGFDASGEWLATIQLDDGRAQTIHLMPGGVAFVAGLYIEQESGPGAPVGAVWTDAP